MARSLAGLGLWIALCAACPTGPDRYDPRNPGDHGVESCPEGMACTAACARIGLCAGAPQL